MSVPPVERAPLTPPPDGRPSVASPGGGHRRARPRPFRPWRVALVLATVALTAAALAIVPRLESKRHLGAAADEHAAARAHCCAGSAMSQSALSQMVSFAPVLSRVPRIPGRTRDNGTRAAHSAAPPNNDAQSGCSACGPSGVAMPTGDIPGWHLTYSQDFSGNSLPADWGTYTGQPGGDPYGSWDPDNVAVSNGELHLSATGSSTGGVGFYGNPQTYGMYLVRMKGDDEPGLAISNIALLWPADGSSWPPEIDFYEDEGGSRDGFTASLHPGPDGDDCCVVRQSTSTTGAQWHTYGVMWTPTSITYTIDGTQWGVVQQSQVSSPGQWPDIPMNLDLQSQNLGSAQPSGSIETMTVAWVVEYTPNQ